MAAAMLSLPPKPQTAIASSSTDDSDSYHQLLEPGPSSQPKAFPPPLCTICKTTASKYTCPGCKTRTCSAACSRRHKETVGCTGERNRAAYVPLGEYGWGTMMDDYVFLEDVGRKVGGWGEEIVRGGYGTAGAAGGRREGESMRGRGRGRGRGAVGGGGGGGARTKRDIFKMQLDIRDIGVDLLPLGMKRRKANQSSWDFKKQTGLLTIEFKFHRPRDPLAPSSTPDILPLILLTHRNRMDQSLLSHLQSIVKERISPKKAPDGTPSLEWLQPLLFPNDEDPEGYHPPHCVMQAPSGPLSLYASGWKPQKVYHKLDVNQPLAVVLKNTEFVEFPTIEVWEEFRGAVLDPQGKVNRLDNQEPELKRRRLDKKTAKERIHGLLGGYGSEEGSEDAEEEEEDKRNVMSLLGEYSDEDEKALSEEEEEKEMEPAALVELLRQVKGEQWVAPDIGGDDVLEWGDLSDADAEGEDDPGDEVEY